MEPLIFDTTVWIDYLQGEANSQSDLLANYIFNDYGTLLCPTIIQEVLQGIRDDRQFLQVKNSLLSFTCLGWNSENAAVSAAELYRNLRKQGLTIRKSNDCLIAAFALKFDVPICHNDSDFDLIASKTNLKIWTPG